MTRVVLMLCLAAAAYAQVKLPPYTRQVLPNGIILDIMPRTDVPLVAVHIAVRGGVDSVPPDLGGLAGITADALRKGTRTRSATQFSVELDSLGATFVTDADEQATHIESEFLAKDFATGLSLVVDALMNPVFPEAEVKKLIAQRTDQMRALKDSPAAAANQYFRNFYFGSGHPYGIPVDELTLPRISRTHLVEYHRRMYTGHNIVAVVAGDVDPENAAAAVSKALSGIPAGQRYSWKTAAPPKRDATKVALIDRPGATQTQILVGLPGIDRRNPDRVALWLVNTLVGGRFTSILNDELRVSSGLTYGARSDFDRAYLPGRITISTFTATDNTGKTLDTAINLLKKLMQAGITAEQLSSARAYLKGTYPAQTLETPDQLAHVVADLELFDLNRGEVDDLFARLDAVTVEKANQVARRYYHPEKLAVLLLGNVAKIEPYARAWDANPVRVSIGTPGLRVPQ